MRTAKLTNIASFSKLVEVCTKANTCANLDDSNRRVLHHASFIERTQLCEDAARYANTAASSSDVRKEFQRGLTYLEDRGTLNRSVAKRLQQAEFIASASRPKWSKLTSK